MMWNRLKTAIEIWKKAVLVKLSNKFYDIKDFYVIKDSYANWHNTVHNIYLNNIKKYQYTPIFRLGRFEKEQEKGEQNGKRKTQLGRWAG